MNTLYISIGREDIIYFSMQQRVNIRGEKIFSYIFQ